MINKLPYSDKVDITTLNKVFNHVTNSYKFLYLRSIIKIIANKHSLKIEKSEIVLDILYDIYYSLNYFHLNLGKQDSIFKFVKEIKNEFKFKDNVIENTFKAQLIQQKHHLEKFTKIIDRYVTQRLIEPFFHNQLIRYKGKLDWKKDNIIKKYSLTSNKVLYRIYDSYIEINEEWFYYFNKNTYIVEGWINYHLINFLQERNCNLIAISRKIYPAMMIRKLNKIRMLFKRFISQSNYKDIYTHKQFNKESFTKFGEFSIDHYVPFSYVVHDRIWNLVPTFKNINSKKSNRIIENKNIFDDFLNIQYGFYCWLIKCNKSKELEDYLDVLPVISIKKQIDKIDFVTKMKNTIEPMLNNAKNQGYEISYILILN